MALFGQDQESIRSEILRDMIYEQSVLELVNELDDVREGEEQSSEMLVAALIGGYTVEDILLLRNATEDDYDERICQALVRLCTALSSVPRPYQQHFVTEG